MSPVIVARFAASIVLNALAFIVWDVGTRPPLRLLRDVAGGVRTPRLLLTGLLRFAAGAGLLVAAGVIARPGMPSQRAFTFIETGMLIAALLIETLIGADLRRWVRTPRR
ncbi:hypothetical protein WPS_10090 [Vulcanimicrobium alpinum]|uniref:Uncharacterized protein n=1 Tax=Vulcanimicrobium alpinum TaxID=3016050 RepID=A0AAN1XUF1_UNVUL|nr:hypothetical protein [Vulcanimicrobium alpinum]BDE05733.1 hypothetical protein WPS_10090 [Vulcanimicrobium alpinum]